VIGILLEGGGKKHELFRTREGGRNFLVLGMELLSGEGGGGGVAVVYYRKKKPGKAALKAERLKRILFGRRKKEEL